MAHSAIVVPVAELESVVKTRIERTIPEYLFREPGETHAHITLLGPFVDRDLMTSELLDQLRQLFKKVSPISFTLDSPPMTLPDGTVYLDPEPADTFSDLTRQLWEAYPEYPPFGGAHSAPQPHLTLAYPWAPGHSQDTMRAVAPEVGPLLPVRLEAATACLNWYEPGCSRTVASFEFGRR
ncbi:2'-5' RNA ligase family protein [Streptomyces sp. NPDC059970]|uniref:2'-5' RNA ligase family protein n=1 Tax=Streptomyces sp. NPDC059970 TaxID=3347019 RepID=UPI00369A2A40